jgi:hypothetical protein
MGRPAASAANACRRIRSPAAFRALLAGDLGAHRDLPVDPDPVQEVTVPERRPFNEPAGSAYNNAAAAWDRRRQDLRDLAGITDVLTDVERPGRTR